MHVSLTEHAERRMRERNLGLTHLLAVLSAGVAMPNRDGRMLHRLEDFCVISSRSRDTLHIITFYRLRTKHSAKPRRPLAMARTKGIARKSGLRDPNLKRKLKSGHIHCLWSAA
ncbi:hypothetical protein LZ24_02485 [Desulfobotulus alkaliphilus]|uniref:DUF4258 domain-containing protein n=1 Tax=Desulfobotulus alkaliphilus TaxID=622671 RepID=A0A562RI11_9BACT|nr:DUF4258 domain-containing protein [Desulfobotulus alkaliphilus]TWI68513.1 hypothetical protein LZ24_02485 [Desulfobotulus alkaliphilus]